MINQSEAYLIFVSPGGLHVTIGNCIIQKGILTGFGSIEYCYTPSV